VLYNIWFHRAGEPVGLGEGEDDGSDPAGGGLVDPPLRDVGCAGVPPRSTQPCAHWLPWRERRR
jgi:hypothetical protein